MKIAKEVFLVLSLAFVASSCAFRLADLTLASTKNISTEKIDLSKTSSKGIFEGRDVKHIIIVFPTGIPNLEEALDRALEEGGGTYMTDAVVYYKWWYIPYIYGRFSFVVKGKVHEIEGM